MVVRQRGYQETINQNVQFVGRKCKIINHSPKHCHVIRKIIMCIMKQIKEKLKNSNKLNLFERFKSSFCIHIHTEDVDQFRKINYCKKTHEKLNN